MTISTSKSNREANRLGLDYAAEAIRLPVQGMPIIDAHAHIGGLSAARIYKQVAELYGISLTYSMTPRLEELQPLRDLFGPAIRFIAVPNYYDPDRGHALGQGFLDRVEKFYELGSRIVKFWAPPRATDYAIEMGDPKALRLDAPLRVKAMELAQELGMVFMVHVSDPDTWFATKYADASVYGTKLEQYHALEEMLQRFSQPWIAAHLGGWPEDLEFLTNLLSKHPNLHLDASATKWMVREVSRHSREEVINFLRTFKGRILFGSDIVTADEHLVPSAQGTEKATQANSPEEAFELYASRYWALRTLWETDYHGPSPIADPDLAMIDPEHHSPMDAPTLRGMHLPQDLLASLYHDAAHNLLEPLHTGT